MGGEIGMGIGKCIEMGIGKGNWDGWTGREIGMNNGLNIGVDNRLHGLV